MIRSFRHNGLRALYEREATRGINPAQLRRVRTLLARLDAARGPTDMDLPGLRLHPLKGALRSFWAVDVSANWRMIFRFAGDDVHDVDLVDYH